MLSDPENLPIIDVNPEESIDSSLQAIFKLFEQEIPGLQKKINKAFDLKQKEKLNQLLHKLSSSCIYCHLSRLKSSLIILKSSIKGGLFRQKELDRLNQEIENALQALKKIKVTRNTTYL